MVIIMMDFNPALGREQQDKRPALVLNNEIDPNARSVSYVESVSEEFKTTL